MDNPISRTERTLFRFVIGALSLVLCLGLLLWGGSRAYRGWQERHGLRRAAAFLSGGDVRAAGLSARRAYQLNPESLAAVRMLAQIDEAAGERTALDWRRKAAQMAPASAEDQIELATSALKFSEFGLAEKALAAVGESGKTAPYHAAAGQLAEARGKLAEAREHWARAVALDPAEKSYQVHLASVRLNSPEATDREEARAALRALRDDPGQRTAATRALISESANRRDSDEVLELARELKSYPEATFQDVLLYLDILKQLRHVDFTSYLTEVEEKAPAQPNDLALLISWMNKSNLSALALNYARGLSPDKLTAWPVPLALANSYTRLADWPGLEQWTKENSWGALDFLRRAYLARALREQEKTVAADREWNAAKKEASAQPQLVSILARTVIEWRWTDEAADLLWTLAKDPAERTEALGSLYRYYSEAGDTGGLYRTLLRLVETMPEDMALQNNLAQVGLLLDAEPDRAQKIAGDLYQKDPTNAAYASTYAFALFTKGNAGGAVKVMATLPEKELQQPAVAAYYGIFLASAGELERARRFLELASEGQLLPEEKALLEKARAKLPKDGAD